MSFNRLPAVLFFVVMSANAADMEQAKHELASEAVACAAYYSFAISLSEKSGYQLGPSAVKAGEMSLAC